MQERLPGTSVLRMQIRTERCVSHDWPRCKPVRRMRRRPSGPWRRRCTVSCAPLTVSMMSRSRTASARSASSRSTMMAATPRASWRTSPRLPSKSSTRRALPITAALLRCCGLIRITKKLLGAAAAAQPGRQRFAPPSVTDDGSVVPLMAYTACGSIQGLHACRRGLGHTVENNC